MPSNFGAPFMDEHLTHEWTPDPSAVADAIRCLLEEDTCFAYVGGESVLRFHDRGYIALKEAGYFDE